MRRSLLAAAFNVRSIPTLVVMRDGGIRKVLSATYDEALSRLPAALKSEGFGVLTEIDIQSTLKQKLGVDFGRYTILGACNPPFAHEALCAELEVGLMLPWNVVVYAVKEKPVARTRDAGVITTKTLSVKQVLHGSSPKAPTAKVLLNLNSRRP